MKNLRYIAATLNSLLTELECMTTESGKIDICIDDLGYNSETLESRAIVMSKVLKELDLKFKKYYTMLSNRDYLRVKKPDVTPPDMSIAFLIECDKNHLEFAKYKYRERMDAILTFKKAFESSDPHTL